MATKTENVYDRKNQKSCDNFQVANINLHYLFTMRIEHPSEGP